MLMEKPMIEIIPRSNSREPFSRWAPSQEYQLIAICVVVFDGYSLLIFVDVIKNFKLWIHIGKKGIFVNKRSAFLFNQDFWLESL